MSQSANRTAGETADPGVTAFEIGVGARLGRTHRVMRAAWEERIADLELSAPQAALLRAVEEWPGSGLRELSRRLGTDAMNAKRLADHLAARGLIRSASDPAHRQRRVLGLTARGESLAAEVSSRASRWNRELGEILGSEELDHLQELLALLESALETAGSPGASRPSLQEERR